MLKYILASLMLAVLALAPLTSVSAEDIVPDLPSVAPDLGGQANIITVSLGQQSTKTGETVSAVVKWFAIGEYQVSSVKDKEMKPLSANLSITDGAGNFCADPVWKTVFAEDQDFTVSAVAIRDCNRLNLRVALLDADMKLLDAVDVTTDEKMMTSPQASVKETRPVDDVGVFESLPVATRLAITIVGLVAVVGLVAFFGRNALRRKSVLTMLLPVMLAFQVFMVAGEVQAETLDIRPGADPSYPLMGTATMYTEKTSYAPGENIIVFGSFSVNFAIGAACPWQMIAELNTEPLRTFSNMRAHDILYTANWSGSGQRTITAPTTPGSYTINTWIIGGCIVGYGSKTAILPITVAVPTLIPGICGTANGGAFSTAPASSLCVSGTDSWTDNTASDGTFNWNCVGTNGGITTSCMANKTTATSMAACGTANGGTFASAPASNLCSVGAASAVYDYGYWSWTCSPIVTCPPNMIIQDLVFTGSGCWATPVNGPALTPVSCAANKGTAAVPTVTFWADSTSVVSGSSTTLRWTSTSATSCTASGSWSGAKAVSGTESTGTLSSNQTYNLSCTGPGGTSGTYTVSIIVTQLVPTVDLKVNGSDGPVALAAGAQKILSWIATNATSCTASGSDAFAGPKAVVPTGPETLTVARTSTDTLKCDGPGGSATDTVQINATCAPTTGAWGDCDCKTEKEYRTNTNASCSTWSESQDCTAAGKNSCRDFNWKEVAP